MLTLIELAKRLIAFNTVSSNTNSHLINFAANLLEQAGFSIQLFPYITQDVEKVNLVATKGPSRNYFAFSAHSDVVPVDQTLWSTNPFELVQIGHEWRARGSCDMKVAIAAMVLAACRIPEASLKNGLMITITADEEVGCLGVRRLVREPEFVAPKYALITEPTQMKPIIGQKGYMFLRITLTTERPGEKSLPAHSADPEKGLNVLERIVPRVLDALVAFKEILMKIQDARFSPPYPTINTGVGKTGETAAKNRVVNWWQADFDLRPLPGQNTDDLFEVLSEAVVPDAVASANVDTSDLQVMVRYVRKSTNPMLTHHNSKLVQAAEQITGKSSGTVSFNTEGPTFTAAGTECVILGPGSIAQAHQVDEWLHDMYMQNTTVDMFKQIAQAMCC